MPNLPESLLGSFAGRDRAAAIYGDLVELAATRGRAWFWMAYARTLMALTWRAQAAFVISVVSVRTMCFVYPRWVQFQLQHLAAGMHINMFFGQLAVASGPCLNLIAMCLWFVLPYVWLRFGRRDRLTQLACVLCLSTLSVFGFREWLVDVSSIVTMVVLLAAIVSSRWRRAFAVLATTFATVGIAMMIPFRALVPTKGFDWLTTTFALAVAALVCSVLHRRLLCQRAAIA